MEARGSRSITELAGDAIGQLAKLIGNEFELARAELSQKAAQVGKAMGLIGAGAILLIPALVMLLFAAASALMHAGLSDPIAYLIVGGVATLIALVLVLIGIGSLSGEAMKPKATLAQIEQDKAAVKEMAR
ncbi:MAG: phage holin family protein [Bradyrhizobium sp.]|nr:phage holin family protein [Bradyrhizobium sp.]